MFVVKCNLRDILATMEDSPRQIGGKDLPTFQKNWINSFYMGTGSTKVNPLG